MANVNGTTVLGRTRSLRAPASASKPTRPPSRGTTAATTTSITKSFAAPTTACPTAPSNISLFLTNLRLLDLDLRPDWPDINAQTFSTRDLAQGQKKRIQSVEWALYHLFALWDPDETRNKLQPFFPPLDQVQSLNLRAALLRALEQAKKNGVLGRDAVVRKTMLDECKGERLEEVLAVFSSAVLKKMVAEEKLGGGAYPALARTMALENRGYAEERAELVALVLAHRVSLKRTLEEKNAARARFRELSDLLALKEKTIARRRAEAQAAKRNAQGKALSEQQRAEVRRAVRNNWTGNERWMEALLYGDIESHKDNVLSATFDRVWRRVQSGRLAELEETSAGLLEQLENRVRGQQERLQKWQGFRERMFGNGAEASAKESKTRPKPKGINLGFNVHESLHLGRTSPRKLPRSMPPEMDSHYEALINGLKSDLAKISPAAPRIPSFFRTPRHPERSPGRTEAQPEPEEISDISDLEEAQPPIRLSPSRRETIRVADEPAFEPVLRKAQTFDEEHAYLGDEPLTPSRLRRAATIQSHSSSSSSSRTRLVGQGSPTKSHRQRLSPAPKPTSHATSPPRSTRSPPQLQPTSPERSPPPSPDRPLSPTQQLADDILASVNAASPSPVKKPRHRLSLAERTRLSMARRTSHANLRVAADEDGFVDHDEDEDEEKPEIAPLPLQRAPVTIPVVAERPPPPADTDSGNATQEGGGYEDLITRTRRSMASFDLARQKAQLERRRSLRKSVTPSTPAHGGRCGSGSYFPAVGEEDGEEGNNTTLLLAEELMNGEGKDDYEAVFMSRPKLKNSPVGTPVREFWD
ncbi:hypothetical protein VTI74DRAFT_3814 [Chaetomium olivicolor]